jgi:hypothetical protein
VLAELVDVGLMVTEDGHYLVLTVPPENFSAPEHVTENCQPMLDDFRNRTNAQFTKAQ